ncbi:MAG: hypothetical protein DWQ04_23345 [Chloroflexi bacterium]|nr:MAG: hypothetical protein DWQ04_23345 [Chloroflexota bacterium]
MSTVTSNSNREKGLRGERPFLLQQTQRIFPFILFLIAFLPRTFGLVARATVWHVRGDLFLNALAARDWAATIQAPHPGVITMWLVAIARWITSFFVADINELSLVQQMSIELIPLELVISLCIVLTFFLLTNLFDLKTAVVATLLLALDPFHISITKTLHVDGVVSTFVMVSALNLLVFIRESQAENRRYLLTSGIFAGLALLSKVPSLFLVPYFFLCLGVWQLSKLLVAQPGSAKELLQWRLWLPPAKTVGRLFLVWIVPLVVVFVLLWPAMWSEPVAALARIAGRSSDHISNPHPKPILFLGQAAIMDPGVFFYPVMLLIYTTAVTLPGFIIALTLLLRRKIKREQQQTLWLMAAFVLFFVVQMTLGDKKASRYILPAFQFVTLLAGIGIVKLLRMWLGNNTRLFNMALLLVIVAQAGISIPNHPNYSTHFNWLLGGTKTILDARVVDGQGQDEGLDLAADYLNNLPDAANLRVGAQGNAFERFFEGKTKDVDAPNVDYVVFTRRVVRDLDDDLWALYQPFQPEHVVEFHDVPYVWIYKARTEESGAPVLNVGDDIRLLGYKVWPMQAKPGEKVRVTLYWEGVNQPTGDFTVFVQMLNAAGQLIVQQDSAPLKGSYPTQNWSPGDFVEDEYELTIPLDAQPGAYRISAGMYMWQTLERLPLTTLDGEVQPDNNLLIDGIEVLPASVGNP